METSFVNHMDDHISLANFVHELNVFRRQIALYPPTHPKTLAGAGKILTELAKLRPFGDCISLGIAPDNLLFNGHLLDGDNPSCRDLGTFFTKLDIAVISFYQALDATELIEFWRLLSSRVSGRPVTTLELALKDNRIRNIHLQLTDYRAFTGASGVPAPTATGHDVWHDFVRALVPDVSGHPADQLAQLLNNNANELDSMEVTGQLVNRLLEQCGGTVDGIGGQLYEFSKKLKSGVREKLHEDTLGAFDQHPIIAEKIIPGLPGDFISEALLSHSRNKKQLSTRLTDLLSTFATNNHGAGHQRTIQSAPSGTAQQHQSDIELLMLEDQHHEYLPDNYQQALQSILAGQIQGSLPADLARKFRNSLHEQMVERQCSEIIFDLLETDIDNDTEVILQNNLIDLSRFFLDTGDFQTLQKTFSRWMSFMNSDRSPTNPLTEKYFGSQTQDSFIDAVLRSVPLWHAEKYAEIRDYLAEVGAPFVEPLIERLGDETDKELRKVWMKLLLELEKTAHPAILAALDDDRWYLVRNLLVIMGQQKGAIPPKVLLNLCEHSHPEVRCEALAILLRVNPPAGHRRLLAEIGSAEPQTLKTLIPLALRSGNNSIFAKLNSLLEAEPLDEQILETKLQILSNLSLSPQPACLLSVMRLAARKDFFLNRLRKQLQAAATTTLKCFPRRHITPLLREMNEQQQTRIHIILSAMPPAASGQSS